jgi:hypothetical protein
VAQQQLFPASREILPFLAKSVRDLLFRTLQDSILRNRTDPCGNHKQKDFLLRVNIDPRILQTEHVALFTDAQHATVLSIITEISPPRQTEWFARLNFRLASLAWRELESAYAPSTTTRAASKA